MVDYNDSRPLIDMVSPKSRASLWELIEIYRRLFERRWRRLITTCSRAVSGFPLLEKLSIVVKAWLSRKELSRSAAPK